MSSASWGLRPSEQIALTVSDFDATRGTLRVNKARVAGVDRATTKTGVPRVFELCPRALAVLHRQLALRDRLQRAGQVRHAHLFFSEGGAPLRSIHETGTRWAKTLARLPIRSRRPYCARHSCVSRNLMLGKNPLWVARQHGHSVRTMLEVYAAWADGRRGRASASGTGFGTRNAAPAPKPTRSNGKELAEREGFEPSKGFWPLHP